MDRRSTTQALMGFLMAGTRPAPARAQTRVGLQVGITPAGQPASGLNPQTGAPEGFAVEIMQAMAADAGLAVQFQPMAFGELQAALQSRKIDAVAASFGITPERQRFVDFTRAYGRYQDRLLVKAADTRSYRSVADLKGLRIATSRGSAFVQPLQEAGAELSLSATPVESVARLEAGSVDGVVENELQLGYLLRRGDRTGLRLAEGYRPILTSQLAFAVHKGDVDLLLKLEGALARLQADGSVAAIKRKWGLE